MEIWIDIKGFEKYQVSSWGRVRNSFGQIIKPYKSEKGYLKVELWKNGEGFKKRVHRLVADAFIENPQGFPQVNHIDGNKENNSVTNLEWVTDKANKNHARMLRKFAEEIRG